jgi:hypothetical protein
MLQHFFTLRTSQARQNGTQRRRGNRLRLESLEDRVVPTLAGFAPYLDMTVGPGYGHFNFSTVPTVQAFSLGFIVADLSTGNTPSWGGYTAYDVGGPNDARINADLATLRQRGGDVVPSFGGAAGSELATRITDVTALKNAYERVIRAYGVTHLDFDIEGAAVGDRTSIDRRSQAIHLVQQDYPGVEVSLTLPVLTNGLDPNGVYVVRSAHDHGVDIGVVNIMAMDYYNGVYNPPMGDYAVSAATGTFHQLAGIYGSSLTEAQLWHKIGVTPMIGLNDDTRDHEFFTTQDANQLLQFAQLHGLGGLSMWSLNREDGTDARPYTAIFSQYGGITQGPTLDPIPDMQLALGETGWAVHLVSNDPNPVVDFQVSASTDNPDLLTSLGFGHGSYLTFTTADGQTGSGDITVTLSDSAGHTATQTFMVSVSSQPDPLTLNPGQGITSPSGQYLLTLQTDGDFVLYGPAQNRLWSGNTGGQNSVQAVMQADGNLVVYGPNGPLWSSGTAGWYGATLLLQDDGTLSIVLGDQTITTLYSPSSGDGQVTFTKTSDWGTGFTGDLALFNPGTATIHGWTVEFDFDGSLDSVWNATVVSHVGNHYVLANLDWNVDLNPGATLHVGFTATPNGSAIPENLVLHAAH